MQNKQIQLAVGVLAILVLGFVAGRLLGGSKTTLVGATQTNPTHVSDSTNWETGYFWGDLEIADTVWADGSFNVSGTSIFGGPATFNATTTFNGPVSGLVTSTLTSLTVNGNTALNGRLNVTGTSTLATTTIAGGASVGGGLSITSGTFVVAAGLNSQFFGQIDQTAKTNLATTTVSKPLCFGPYGAGNYYTVIGPSTTAAALSITTSTACN